MRYSPKNLVHLRRLSRRSEATPHAVLPPLPSARYDIAYVDPPWHYYGSPIKDAAAAKHYPLMSLEELSAIDVRKILNKRAAVFVWATCPRLQFAFKLIESWGLHYRGVAYVWVKVNKRGAIIAGQGVTPTFTKPTSELLLAATTTPTGRPFPILDLAQPQVVLARRPQRKTGRLPGFDRTALRRAAADRAVRAHARPKLGRLGSRALSGAREPIRRFFPDTR